MSLIVQKFGGSSVGTIERLTQVAQIVHATKQQGHAVVVVVSAMQGETDRLIQLAKCITHRPESREYDALVSTGECVSAALLSLSLKTLKLSAVSLTGPQIPIETTDVHQHAHITTVRTDRLRALLDDGIIPVVTGFQGVNAKGDVTTLSRGGSDITAVAIANALQAVECQIYTDVDGVYTSDPRIVVDAKRLDQLTYAEMLALASLGAKVLHPQAVRFAKKNNLPVRVLSTFNPGPGTLITQQVTQKKPWVSGVAFDRKQAKLSILGIPKAADYLDHLLGAIRKAQFEVDMAVQNISPEKDTLDFSFTVHLDDYHRAADFSNTLAKSISARDVVTHDQLAKLSLVGWGMKSHAGVAAKIFQTLGAEGIDIYLISSSEAKISAVIDEKHLEKGARLLHQAFALG